MILPLMLALAAVWGLWRHEFIRYDWDWLLVGADLIHDPWHLFGMRVEPFDFLRVRPVAELSFAVPQALWGLHPFPHYLLQTAIHLLNTWLVGRLARSWLGSAGAGVAAAALFAVWWPGREAFLYLHARSELLGTMWMLLAALALERSVESGSGRGWCAAAVAGALATYEGSVGIIPVLLLRERLRNGRVSWRRQAPVLAVVAVWAVVQIALRAAHPASHGAWAVRPDMPWVFLRSLAAVWAPTPDHQAWEAFTGQFPGLAAALYWPGGSGAIATLGVAAALARVARRGPDVVRLAAAWAVCSLLVPSGIPGGASRYLYVAAPGAAILTVASARRLPWRGAVAAGVSVWLIVQFAACRFSIAEAFVRSRAAGAVASDIRRLAPALNPDRPVVIWGEESGENLAPGYLRLHAMFRVVTGRPWTVAVRSGRPARPGEANLLLYRGGRLRLP